MDDSSTRNTEKQQRENEDQVSRDAFEKERQILLSGVAESLTHVLEQMTKANENLNGLEHGTEQVEQIADLWKSAYRKSDDQQQHNISQSGDTGEQSTSARTSLSVLRGDDMDMEY